MIIKELSVAGSKLLIEGSDKLLINNEKTDRRGLRLRALRSGDFDLLFVAEKCVGTFVGACEKWERQIGGDVNWLAGVRELHDLVASFKTVEAEGGPACGQWAEDVYKDFWRGIIERVEPADQRDIKAALKSVAGKREVTEIGGDAAGDRA